MSTVECDRRSFPNASEAVLAFVGVGFGKHLEMALSWASASVRATLTRGHSRPSRKGSVNDQVRLTSKFSSL